jgi:5-methylcytosine-specific restriction enzyme A
VAGRIVDHKVPHRGDPVLFWDPDNLQTMCQEHHNRWKAAQEYHQERFGFDSEVGDDGWPKDPAHPVNVG